MKFFLSLGIKTKLILLVTVSVLGMSFITVNDSLKERNIMLSDKKERIESIINGVFSQINHLQQASKSGNLTKEEAQSQAKQIVATFRYDNGNYLWINDFDPKMIMHPLNPKLDGEDLSKYEDKKGNLLFVNMAQTAKKSGQGYVEYYWMKPNNPNPVPKMSFVKAIPEWQWVIGTGIYIDDVNEEFINSLIENLLILLLIVLVSVAFAYLVFISINRPLQKMTEIMNKVSNEGDLSEKIEIDQTDELGKIAHDFNHHITFLSNTISEIQHVMSQVEQGKTEVKIETEMQGIFNHLKQSINQSIGNINQTIVILGDSIEALSKGKFNQQTDSHLQGHFGEVIHHTETVIHTLKVSFDEINKIMEEMSVGKFDRRINIDVSGEFEKLENNINKSLDSVEHAILHIADALSRQASGDYHTKTQANLTGDLEILENNLNSTCDQIGSTILQVNDSATNVFNMSQQLSEDAQHFSEKTQSQAATLEETSASTEEITSTVKQNTDYAREANNLATAAQEKAEKGSEITENAVIAMQHITDASHQISDITSLIDSIAFQTNLLALNAAVEAARAGDHGRGFAVVAGEVRNLAQKSSDAAKDIRNLINDSVEKIEEGAAYVNQSKSSLSDINDGILEVSKIIYEILSSSEEQAKSIEHINQAIMSLDKDTQQNAHLIEQTAQNAQNMQQAAQQMLQQMDFFKSNEGKAGKELLNK